MFAVMLVSRGGRSPPLLQEPVGGRGAEPSMSIRILITGGTIDGLEYDLADNSPKDHRSLVPELVRTGRITLEHSVEVLMQKDSKFIGGQDRELISRRCLECPEEKIVITHGTETMSKTAKFLGEKNLPKTIVITGSFIPADENGSDAQFNLGAAFSAIQLLPHGVYIVMNGGVFSWRNVRKNWREGVFETER